MSAIRVVVVGVLAMLLALTPVASRAETTVVLLPIADYSPADTLAGVRQQGQNLAVALTEQLSAKGMAVAPQEKVFNSLVKSGSIEPLSKGKNPPPDSTTKSLANELNGPWSEWMKSEITTLITAEQKRMTPGLAEQDNHLGKPATSPLGNEQVAAIAQEFGAGIVVRGRLLAYELVGEFPREPLRRAILPFCATIGHDEIYAVAAADTYDRLDGMMLAGLFEPAAGQKRVLRLQLWAQDGESGALLWSGMRQTDWSGGNKEEAIAKAATALIDELWTAIAVDSDGDTVFDHRDRCPGTPAGIAVDNLGCPGDEDRDKVPDYLDECPRTPAGAPVDKRGCPKDSDNDGVPDYLDGCADTPAGLTVDGKGCPPDGDDDGVADYLDKCPDTPAGRLVDEAGCPRPLKETVSQELRVEFAFNSAEINSCYHDHLRRVAEFLTAYPETKALVEGHTDHEGPAAYNLDLSQRRANAVLTYLIEKFKIDPARLNARGFGESRPIANNRTPEGKRRNRRAVAIFTTTVGK